MFSQKRGKRKNRKELLKIVKDLTLLSYQFAILSSSEQSKDKSTSSLKVQLQKQEL